MDTESLNPSSKTFSPPPFGQIISNRGQNYLLGNLINQGGFGAVFECTDGWGNDLVAKIILPQNNSTTYEEVKERWVAELQNLVSLRHPNITYLHDAFEFKDTFYLIIERCSQTLSDLFLIPDFNGEIWLPSIAKFILQAVNYIHKSGYIHKDIHPGNVFVSHIKDDMVPSKDPVFVYKIGDLGISRLQSDIDIYNTTLAKWIIPPEYLNPSEFGLFDKRVDIYHTGLLFLAVLRGKIDKFSQEQILSGIPRKLAENHPSRIAPIIAKALRRHVDDRTQSALDLWKEIASVL